MYHARNRKARGNLNSLRELACGLQLVAAVATCVGLSTDGSNNVYTVVGTSDTNNKGVIKQIWLFCIPSG